MTLQHRADLTSLQASRPAHRRISGTVSQIRRRNERMPVGAHHWRRRRRRARQAISRLSGP